MNENTTLLMPIESVPHERTWMSFPPGGYFAAALESAGAAWASVANVISDFEPVSMLCSPSTIGLARTLLAREIELIEVPLDDAWLRDAGPTFVHDETGAVVAIDWVFNGWGGQEWASWDNDARLARFVADLADVPVRSSLLVNEGGGICVDGAGLVVLTRTVQLDPGRNPRWSEADVEAELSATIGANKFVWLDRGLEGDYGTFGTRGHVDLLCVAIEQGKVAAHDQQDVSHTDHAQSQANIAVLEAAGLEVTRIVAPTTKVAHGRPCDWSYLNAYLANGLVLLGVFGEPGDDAAAACYRDLFPDRTVVTIDAREIFRHGGGIHCITQQQPRALNKENL